MLIPCSLFKIIVTSSIEDAIEPEYLMFCLVGVAAMIFSGIFLGEKLCERQDQKGVMAQAIFRGNTVLFGIPVVSMLYPNESIVLTTSMIAIVVPIFNICAVISLQLHAGMKTDINSFSSNAGSFVNMSNLHLWLALPDSANKNTSCLVKVELPINIRSMFRRSTFQENISQV